MIPPTRVVPSGKTYNRNAIKHEDFHRQNEEPPDLRGQNLPTDTNPYAPKPEVSDVPQPVKPQHEEPHPWRNQ